MFEKKNFFALYSVSSCQRILKNPDFGRYKGENNEEQDNERDYCQCLFRRFANQSFGIEEPRFINKYYRCRNEKDSNVYKVG